MCGLCSVSTFDEDCNSSKTQRATKFGTWQAHAFPTNRKEKKVGPSQLRW